MEFGLELSGRNASWSFETDGIRITYGTGWRVHALLREFGELYVPNEALADVSLTNGRRPALELRLRPGSEPIHMLAAGGLPQAAEPYRLTLDSSQNDLASYYQNDIQARISGNPEATLPATRFLVTGPRPPVSVNAYDGAVSFDGQTVSFRWNSVARRAKREMGICAYDISRVRGVEWHDPADGGYGHLRLILDDSPSTRTKAAADPAAAVLYGGRAGLSVACAIRVALGHDTTGAGTVGTGPTSGGLTLASLGAGLNRLLEPRATPAAPADRDEQQPADVDEILTTIRKLGELRDAGLLTDEEFETKKAELLRRI